ncbi:hypothetical protein AKJ55_00720 [candidate division MSBL1 archaeon SCGC-AAA382M17]|uniref:SWIM-type domain-containing protein n=1 Tax=candidate division MSBL1 archaeon SCGC-AAA382M17 TaxID=1698284 RepID=A0ABR5TJR7_9EURY|nr:hypothetical protein AKJ55_00720 [candidate division MSBL1 archaeon SCGC-AAA382M17]
MTSEDFKRKKKELFQNLKSSEELDEALEKQIIDLYGDRGKRAIKVVNNDGVWKEEDRWFVQGREEKYEVVRSHCSCYDYVLNITTGKTDVDMCYHALAKNIKELLDSKQ